MGGGADGGAEAAQAFAFADGGAFRNGSSAQFFPIVLVYEGQHLLDPLRVTQLFGVCFCLHAGSVCQQ